jgi:hypothetical protein
MKKFLRKFFSKKKRHDSTPETGRLVTDADAHGEDRNTPNPTLPAPTAIAYPIG